jgi:hypothetical protein
MGAPGTQVGPGATKTRPRPARAQLDDAGRAFGLREAGLGMLLHQATDAFSAAIAHEIGRRWAQDPGQKTGREAAWWLAALPTGTWPRNGWPIKGAATTMTLQMSWAASPGHQPRL